MTIVELNNTIKSICSFNYNEGSIYDLNNKTNIKYPLINFHINYVRSNNSLLTINCSLIYVDRLIQDNSNKLLIQSDGIIYLKEIINRLYNIGIEAESNYIITPFNESFNDITAGNFVTLNLTIPDELSDCEEY